MMKHETVLIWFNLVLEDPKLYIPYNISNDSMSWDQNETTRMTSYEIM